MTAKNVAGAAQGQQRQWKVGEVLQIFDFLNPCSPHLKNNNKLLLNTTLGQSKITDKQKPRSIRIIFLLVKPGTTLPNLDRSVKVEVWNIGLGTFDLKVQKKAGSQMKLQKKARIMSGVSD